MDALTGDPRVRKITFTGSMEVGDQICRNAGIKKVTMELGSNSPLIVMNDADIEKVAAATVASGFANAGQVCISTQRVFADRDVYADFLDALVGPTEAFIAGNPLDESIKMGPMIRESDAARVHDWIAEAVGRAPAWLPRRPEGTLHAPTVVADVKPDMRVSREELFGPAVAVSAFSDIDEAISMANDSRFGLSAGIFTQTWTGRCGLPGRSSPATCTSTRRPSGGPTSCPTAASGQRNGQGRAGVRHRGDDGAEDGGFPCKRKGPAFARGRLWGGGPAAPFPHSVRQGQAPLFSGQSRTNEIITDPPRSMLVVTPHPEDAEAGAAPP